MAGDTQLLYLEPDDEVTTVVRRLRETDVNRVVLVAPGRSKVAGSAVSLRLLAAVAAEEERELALVADAAGRGLAGEAGIPSFATVAEASADGATPLEAPPPSRARIHVVRGDEATSAVPVAAAPAAAAEETQAVRLAPAAPVAVAPRAAAGGMGATRLPRALIGAAVALVLLAGAAIAAAAPSATITIVPGTVPIGPRAIEVRPPLQVPETDTLEVSREGAASGERVERTAAAGTVTFLNWNTVRVEVPEGTELSVAGGTRFVTTQTVEVPNGQFTPQGTVQAGEASAPVLAAEPGPGGNVAAEAIDTVESRNVMVFLRGFPNNPRRLVVNPAATAGGSEEHIPVVLQEDVDAVAGQVAAELTRLRDEAFAGEPERIYPPMEPPRPAVEIPDGLVGSEGQETFSLTGTLAYARPYVLRDDAEEAARGELLADPAAPAGTTLLSETVSVELGDARLEGAEVVVEAVVAARAVHDLDTDAIRERVTGLTEPEVRQALGDIGQVEVELWPGWVDRVPRLPFRVSVEVSGG
ncbi:MAG TPA: hypothetical protein VHK28_09805 [Candidatus Limnocylindria bacterium]|nr:hypothetical protein [Candidatus Limnocylindria bacterium]